MSKEQGLLDAADIPDDQMRPPAGWRVDEVEVITPIGDKDEEADA
jgi:hypothetical protein